MMEHAVAADGPPDLVLATDERYVLAEGPTWDPIHGVLLWVDIEAGLVVAGDLQPDGRVRVRETVSLGETVGAVAVSETGGWVIAGAERLHVRSAEGRLVPGRRILPPGCGRRLNDAKPSPSGRLLVGSLPLVEGSSTTEELFLVGAGGTDRLDGDLTLANGLAWTADGHTLFSVDTGRRVIHRRAWDPAGGPAGERSVHIAFDAGYPDGICTDAADHLWVALWGLGEVRRYAPDGALTATIGVPAPHPSSVAFAGPDLGTLVITTASRDLDEAGRAAHPGAGALFTTRPGVRGVSPALCATGVGS